MAQNGDPITLHWPRYSNRPFPPYRFLPGRDPHPTASPRGHSYLTPGHVEPPVVWKAPEHWRESEEYLYGCDLYNHGYWWEAHEAWEGLWRVCPKENVQRRFLQWLIQVSACHLKVRLASREGVERLRESLRGHVEFVSARLENPMLMGLDVPSFHEKVEQYIEQILDASTHLEHILESFPYLLLSDDR